jgi:hypothetical protein
MSLRDASRISMAHLERVKQGELFPPQCFFNSDTSSAYFPGSWHERTEQILRDKVSFSDHRPIYRLREL